MTPEMQAYVDRLEAIRVARDEQARLVAQTEREMEARKDALASENEDVKALVDRIAELRESLAAAETALAELYAADETLVSLEARRSNAEAERDAKQREMHSVIAAAMDARAARSRNPRPVPGTPVAPASRPQAPAPVAPPSVPAE